MWGLIKEAFGGLFSSLLARWFPKKDTEIENVEVAHAVEDKNRLELGDGESAARLRTDWSRD